MARKKGRDISGWLLIDKPAGIGSTDVVSRVRWACMRERTPEVMAVDVAAAE